jgi:DNA-binding transcriptional LysR family regulator
MPLRIDWESQIGRRLRFRDLHVFFTVLDLGSMSQAAARLGVTAPTVSEVIADLEHTLGVRLLDRTPKGVLPTPYGQALAIRGRAAFDELRQGIRDIEFIADPATSEVRIGCPESLAAFLVLIIERIARQYPRMRFHVQQVSWPTLDFPELHERKTDLVLGRLSTLAAEAGVGEDLHEEVLFDDPFAAVVGASSKWARKRKINLADLVDAAWISTPSDVLAGRFLTEAFEARGLKPPRPTIETSSIHLRQHLASRGQYIAVLPRSVLRLSAKPYSLKELPIKLSTKASPVGIVTLRKRTPTPAVQVFIDCARKVASSLANDSRRIGETKLSMKDAGKSPPARAPN